MNRKDLYAVGLIALSGTLYGFLGYFGTELLKGEFTVSSMLFWRFFIASLGMLGYSKWHQRKFRLDFKRLTWRDCPIPFVLGALFYSGSSAFYFMASNYTGTGLAMVIFFCYPMFIALFAWLKNERQMNKLTLGSLLIIMLGLILLRGDDENPVNVMGILLAVTSALCYAVYVYKSKSVLMRISSVQFSTIVCLSCATMFVLMALFTHSMVMPVTFQEWFWVIAVGVFATALPIQLLLEGLKRITPLKASILSVLEPVVTVLVGWVMLKESVSFWQTFGILTVIFGALMVQFSRE